MLKLGMEGADPQKLSRAPSPHVSGYIYIYILSGTLSFLIQKFPRPHPNSLRIQIECSDRPDLSDTYPDSL